METRGEARGGDVSLLQLSATGFCVYQFGLHTPASENPCPHFGLHSLDVCFLFTTTTCHSWECFLSTFQHTHERLCIKKKKSLLSQVFDEKRRFHVGTSWCVICGVTVTEQETSNMERILADYNKTKHGVVGPL